MKIAFTTIDGELESPVGNSFGRTPRFIIYDTGEKSYSILGNPYRNVFGKAGIQAAQLLISHNVNVLFTGKIGSNAFRFLYFADVEVFTGITGQFKIILDKYEKGELSPMTDYSGNMKRNRFGQKSRGDYN